MYKLDSSVERRDEPTRSVEGVLSCRRSPGEERSRVSVHRHSHRQATDYANQPSGSGSFPRAIGLSLPPFPPLALLPHNPNRVTPSPAFYSATVSTRNILARFYRGEVCAVKYLAREDGISDMRGTRTIYCICVEGFFLMCVCGSSHLCFF